MLTGIFLVPSGVAQEYVPLTDWPAAEATPPVDKPIARLPESPTPPTRSGMAMAPLPIFRNHLCIECFPSSFDLFSLAGHLRG
jgi:hypothetical protein